MTLAAIAGLTVVILTLTLKPSHVAWLMLPLLLVSPNWLPVSDGLVKAGLLGIILLMILRFGVSRDRAAVLAIAGLTISLGITFLNGLPFGLTAGDAMRAWAGYAFAWFALLVNWPADAQRSISRMLALAAPVCVALGALLTAAGLWQVAGRPDGGQLRLQGSLIPPHLAMLALLGVAVILTDTAMTFTQRRATLLTGANLAITLATLTRGAILGLAVFVIILVLMRLITGSRQHQTRAIRAALLFLTLGVMAAVPALLARSSGTSYEGGFNSSGRSAAWEFYWRLGEGARETGRGLGFSAIANKAYSPTGVQTNFAAPHNEYIHLILDGGVLLLVVYLGAFALLLAGRKSRASRSISAPSAAALAVMLASFAYVDNPISTPQFVLPFLLVLAVGKPHRARRARLPSYDRSASRTQAERQLL